MDAQVQILGVTVRNTRTGKVVYDVQCSDGKKRQVWDAALANQLNAYTNPQGHGQAVVIRFDQKPNGQFLNESIQAFAPPGQQLPPDSNAQPAMMPAGGQPLAAPSAVGMNTQPIQAAPSGGSEGRWTPEVTTRITKLASYEYASHVVGGLFAGAGPEGEVEAVAMLDRIARHVYTQARSHENQPANQGQIVPTATTPQEVAQQVPGVQVGAPVAAAQDASAEAGDVIQWD